MAALDLSRTPLTQTTWSEVHATSSPSPGGKLPFHAVTRWEATDFCNALPIAEGLSAAHELDDMAEVATWIALRVATASRTEAEWRARWADKQWSVRASVHRRSHPTLRVGDGGF